MKHVLIVGKKYAPLAQTIESLGHSYTLLQDVAATRFPDKKFSHRVVADFSDRTSLLATIDAIHAETPIDAVVTIYEHYVLPTSLIGEHLGVPHLPIESAEACTDKYKMRSLFMNAPEKISPAFAVVNNQASLEDFANEHAFPLILKPANLAKSLLVTKSMNIEELISQYKKSMSLITSTYAKYAPGRDPKMIVEEFLEGSIHSIDAFVDSGGTPHLLDEIVDYQTGYDIGYDDNFHYSRLIPSSLSPDDQTALRHAASLGVQALRMKNSPAHIEIIMTKDGPNIVEIGARNGGYRERMHGLANGIDLLRATVELALGDHFDVSSQKHEPVAVLELFPKNPGSFVGISNQSALEQLPSLQYLSVKPTAGNYVGKAGEGYKMCAVVILHNADREQFEKDLTFVNESVFVETN